MVVFEITRSELENIDNDRKDITISKYVREKLTKQKIILCVCGEKDGKLFVRKFPSKYKHLNQPRDNITGRFLKEA